MLCKLSECLHVVMCIIYILYYLPVNTLCDYFSMNNFSHKLVPFCEISLSGVEFRGVLVGYLFCGDFPYIVLPRLNAPLNPLIPGVKRLNPNFPKS